MKTPVERPDRMTCAVNLDLSHGRHGASARIELFERDGDGRDGAARLALHGWIDRAALRRLDETLVELAERGVDRLTVDCSRVRHIEFAALPDLHGMLARFWSAPGCMRVSGLSPHLRDLLRVAGWSGETGVPAPGGPATIPFAPAGLRREWAT